MPDLNLDIVQDLWTQKKLQSRAPVTPLGFQIKKQLGTEIYVESHAVGNMKLAKKFIGVFP